MFYSDQIFLLNGLNFQSHHFKKNSTLSGLNYSISRDEESGPPPGSRIWLISLFKPEIRFEKGGREQMKTMNEVCLFRKFTVKSLELKFEINKDHLPHPDLTMM